MITIKDISKKCGVSPATVSKALNGYGDVSASTLEKVRKAQKRPKQILLVSLIVACIAAGGFLIYTKVSNPGNLNAQKVPNVSTEEKDIVTVTPSFVVATTT